MHGTTIITMLILGLGQVVDDTAVSPSAEIEAAIARLAASKYEQRQQATELLWSAGPVAIPALERALKHGNAEVRARAAYVLENSRQGVTADTPRSVLREVQRFRGGDEQERRVAMNSLENSLRPRIVLSLMRTESDPRLAAEWSENVLRAIAKTMLTGHAREVEATLRDAATTDEWMRHWAAYAAQTGRLDDEFAWLKAQPTTDAKLRGKQLAYLLRAKGEMSEARRVAESDQASPEFVWNLILEQRDWTTAARQLAARIDRDPPRLGQDLESLSFALAYHRLNHDLAGADRFAAALRQVADEAAKSLPDLDPRRQDVAGDLVDRQWQVGKALMLNGRYDEAVQVLRRIRPDFAFELLCSQQRYREAFDVAGVTYPTGFDRAWFQKLAIETAAADDAARQRFALGVHAIRQLHFLGYRDQTREWLGALHQSAMQDRGTLRMRMLCETATKLGMRDLARRDAAKILEAEGSTNALSLLYPNRTDAANVWWEYFRDENDRESNEQSLTRMDALLIPLVGPRPDLMAVGNEMESRIPHLVEAKRFDWWHALGETFLLHGQRETARRYFARAAAGSSADALRMGDLLAADRQWNEAAEWYEKAGAFDRLKPLPRFLLGQMRIQAGEPATGEPLVADALVLPFGADDARLELATALKDRGYRDESLRQFELLTRVGEPGGSQVVEAAKHIGNAVYTRDELRGADRWETLLLCCLRPKWGFQDANGYVQIPFLIHKTRSIGLLKAERVDYAIREVAAAQVASPLNIELAEELVPPLKKANAKEAAEDLFQRSYRSLQQQSRDFPDCANFQNNLAWLLARNGRELEEALTHARRAVELEPNSAAYLDTLGEVQFRRGEIAEAIDCAERCLKIDPRSKHYQEQLARFRAGRPD